MAKAQEEKATDPVMKRMEELEAQLQAANLRAQQLESKEIDKSLPSDSESFGSGQGQHSPRANLADQPVGTEDGYLFEVRCIDKNAQLPTKKVRCCDESEAIRWYAVTTPHQAQPGRALDTAKFRCVAVCLEEPKRLQRIANERKKAFLRKQYESGKDLKPEELELIGVI